MTEETLEVYCNETNFTVIRVRERSYPGVLIQGDSLMGIVGDLKEAVQLFDEDREESL